MTSGGGNSQHGPEEQEEPERGEAAAPSQELHEEPDMDDPQVQLVVVLGELWRARNESPDKPWSLAKLSKRVQLPMSSLRRLLTELTSAGLVEVELRPDGTGSAALTEQGVQVCTDLFDAESP